MALILIFSYGNIIVTKMHESSPIWFLTFAEMVPQACLWCLPLFATEHRWDYDIILFSVSVRTSTHDHSCSVVLMSARVLDLKKC